MEVVSWKWLFGLNLQLLSEAMYIQRRPEAALQQKLIQKTQTRRSNPKGIENPLLSPLLDNQRRNVRTCYIWLQSLKYLQYVFVCCWKKNSLHVDLRHNSRWTIPYTALLGSQFCIKIINKHKAKVPKICLIGSHSKVLRQRYNTIHTLGLKMVIKSALQID